MFIVKEFLYIRKIKPALRPQVLIFINIFADIDKVKKTVLILSLPFLFLGSTLIAQDTTPAATDGTATEEATPPATDDPAAAPTETENQPADSAQRDVPGFDGVVWGTKYADVKQHFIDLMSQPNVEQPVEIISDTPDREILIARENILYNYAFYKNPVPATEDPMAEENNALFFYAESRFPLVNSDDLYTKLVEKYGERTASTMDKNNRGAYVWDLPTGYLVQWIEPYKEGTYTRNISYLSKSLKDQINKDLKTYQYQKELAAIEAILP